MAVLPYNPKIEVIQSTPEPWKIVQMAAANTQYGKQADFNAIDHPTGIHKFLLDANHTSLFEHVSMTLDISQISRSTHAQLLRHRLASPTSSSQHYQSHDSYDFYVHPKLLDSWPTRTEETLYMALGQYREIMSYGMPKEEARQFLPMAIEERITFTVNARSLINIVNLRCCLRNTFEMTMFGVRLQDTCRKWYPELFNHVGEDCFMSRCKQGAMACTETRISLRYSETIRDFYGSSWYNEPTIKHS